MTPRPGRWRGPSLVADLRSASPVVRLLTLSQLVFNVGFYLVVPYLSVYLVSDLGVGAAMVGLVLGVRTFSQQGLFVVGGTLTDRFGPKAVVLAGCLIRIAGLVLLAWTGSLAGVIAACVLIGFAAALFSPAVETALAIESERERSLSRAEVFALFAVCGQIGAFTGPLLGAALLLVDFAAACLAAAGVFVLVTLAHARWLPNTPGRHSGEPVTAGWGAVLANRRFVVFAVVTSAGLVAYNQLYLLLPLQLERLTGSQAALGWFFAGGSVLVVLAQLPITRWCAPRRTERVLPAGFAMLGAAFLPVAAAAAFGGGPVPGIAALVAFVIVLTVGEMITVPLIRDAVPRLAGDARLGAHYGFLSSVGGLAVLAGSTLIGAVDGALPGTGPGAAGVWLVAAAIPLVSAVAIAALFRRTPLPGTREAAVRPG